MLSGRQPFEADTPMGVVVKQITDPVPHILDLNPNLPPEVEEIIETAMAKNRGERFSTTREMANALEAVVRSGPSQDAGKTVIAAAGSTKIQPAKTRLGAKPVVPAPVPAAQGKGKGSNFTWIIVGVVALCIIVSAGVGGGLYLTRGNPLDPFAETSPEPTATERGLQASPTEPPVSPTIGGGVLNPTPEPTVEPTATLVPTLPPVIVRGGADKVAFLQDDNIWVINLDGTELAQLTTDGAEKSHLQWLPDGRTILYIMGKSVKTVDAETTTEEILTSFNNAEYLEAFQVSRDGKSVAISMNRELYVLPFDVETLAAVTKKSELLKIIEDKGCLFYNDQAIKDVRWSDDGQKIAFVFMAAVGGQRKDTIRVLDISRCSSATPDRLDDFPGARFNFPNEIVNFDWDGENLFFLNSNIRNGGFGDLIFYNMETHKFEKMAPLTGCCYRDATWSPDGSYVSFAFQDMGLGTKSPILLYYVPFASMDTGGSLNPIEGNLTTDFFTDLREAPWPVLHPEQP
jgi:hypothetical protein